MKKHKWIWIGLAVVLIAAVLIVNNPQIRTNLFVRMYHEQIERALKCTLVFLQMMRFCLAISTSIHGKASTQWSSSS